MDFAHFATQIAKRADQADARMGRIEDKLDRILEKVTALPTKEALWGMVMIASATGICLLSVVLSVLTYLHVTPR